MSLKTNLLILLGILFGTSKSLSSSLISTNDRNLHYFQGKDQVYHRFCYLLLELNLLGIGSGSCLEY